MFLGRPIKMFYSDIMKIPQLKDLTLLGGKDGMHRPIRWLYFADCIECLDDSENLGDWIHGGELIIVTHTSITQNIAKLKQFMYVANEKNAAGFIIHVGRIATEIIQTADELSLPLFELSLSIKLVDLSQIICKKLIEEENKQSTLERIFTELLFKDWKNNRDLLYQTQFYGIDFLKPFCIASFTMLFPENQWPEELQLDTYKTNLNKFIQYEFYSAGIPNLLKSDQNNNIIVMIPLYKIKDNLAHILKRVEAHFWQFYDLRLKVGISNSYSSAEELKTAFDEAIMAVQIAGAIKNKDNVIFYKDIGIFSILAGVDNVKILEKYYKSWLEPLMKCDTQQGKTLCDTLEMYLQCNCKITETANALFMHRNTLRYRLDKIESVFGHSLSDLTFCMELQFAFKVKSYWEMVKLRNG